LTKHIGFPGKQKINLRFPGFTIDPLPRVSERLIKVHMFPFEKYN